MTIKPSVSLLTLICFLANTMLSGCAPKSYLKKGHVPPSGEVRLADATADHPLEGTVVVRDARWNNLVFLVGSFQREGRVLDLALAVDRDAWMKHPPKGKRSVKLSQSKDEKGPIFLGIIADKNMVTRLRGKDYSAYDAYDEIERIIAKWRAGKEVPAWFVTERIEGTLTVKIKRRTIKRKLSLRVERPGLDGEWGTDDDIVFHASGKVKEDRKIREKRKVRDYRGKLKLWWDPLFPLKFAAAVAAGSILLTTSPIWVPLGWWLFKDGIVF